jgi:O-antigen/teichoic acid export membrane protein
MAAPATYLLQRDLNFRAVGLIQVGSYAAGYVAVGMPMALMGWGVSSLVAAWIVQALVVFIASYAVKPHAIKPLFWYEGGSTAVGTGKAVFFTNVVNWLLNNMDRILIGRLLNAQALGLYNVAYNLATMPNTLLLGALQPAFLAAGAQLQDQRERLGRVFVQMVATVLVLGLPAFGLLALLSPDLVQLLYGDQWNEAGWVLGVLFVCMPAYVLWGLATPVLWNTGRKQYEFALQIPLVVIGAIAFYLLAGQGILVAAMVAGGLLVLRGLVMGVAALRALHLSPRVLAPHAARGLLLAAVCAASAIAGQQLTQSLDSPFLSLAASSSLAVGLSLTLVLLRPQLLGEPTASMVLRFVPRLQFLLARALPVHAPDALTPKHSEAT